MKIFFGQIYIEPGASFPWSHHFQVRLSKEVTACATPLPKFIAKYGDDWSLIFNVSAKRAIQITEIRGPSVFKKDNSVEFTVFLPFDAVPKGKEFAEPALELLLDGVFGVLDKVGIETGILRAARPVLVKELCASSEMFKDGAEPDASPNGGPATRLGNSSVIGGPPSVS